MVKKDRGEYASCISGCGSSRANERQLHSSGRTCYRCIENGSLLSQCRNAQGVIFHQFVDIDYCARVAPDKLSIASQPAGESNTKLKGKRDADDLLTRQMAKETAGEGLFASGF